MTVSRVGQRKTPKPANSGIARQQAPPPKNAHYLFISYKHGVPSTRYAKELYETFKVTCEALDFDIYMDDKENVGGDLWSENVEVALQRSTHFLVLLNNAYWLSRECRRELDVGLERFRATGVPRLLFVKAGEIRPELLLLQPGAAAGSGVLQASEGKLKKVSNIHFLGPFDKQVRLQRLASDPIRRSDQFGQLLTRFEATLGPRPR